MQRRECLHSLALAGLTLGTTPLMAQQRPFEDGREYISLDKPVPTEAAAGKVEVIEFFWYSCPHCNHFEPQLEQWLQKLPKHVSFKRVPVAFRDNFVPQQRLFYTLEAMGKVDAMHKKVFHAIHDEKLTLDRENLILDWVEKQGLDRKQFASIYNAFSTNAKASRAAQLQRSFQVSGVPSLGIAGRYYTDGSMAGNMARALQVADHLIEKSRKG